MNLKNKKVILNVFILIIIPLVFILLGYYFSAIIGRHEEKEIKDRISSTSKTIATTINAEKFKSLTVSPEDNNNPNYQFLRKEMIEIGDLNKVNGTHWFYTFVPRDGKILFSVDSITDENHSEPGDEYLTAKQDFLEYSHKSWNDGKTYITEPYTDQWGTFISVISPIKDELGNTVSLLGTDIDYHNYYLEYIRNYQKIPYIISIIFIIIFFYFYVYFYISKNKRAREKNEKLRLNYALEGAGDGLWDYNLSTKEVFYSKRWKEMLGFKEGEIKNNFSEWEKLIHPEDKKKVLDTVNQHVKGVTKKYENTHRLLCKNGEYKWIRSRGKIVSYDKKGNPLRMVGTHSDLDEFKKIQLELGQKLNDFEKIKTAALNVLEDVQEEKNKVEKITKRLKVATESAKIGVWDWDVVNNVLVWDDQMFNLYGIKREDFSMAYDAWQKGLHPEDRKMGDDAIQKALKGEKDFNIVFRVIWPNKEIRYLRAYAIIERDKKGKPLNMIGVNFDITKDYEIDRAKTEFVSLASHQLKTPVGAMSWSLEMLLDGDYGKITKKQTAVIKDIYAMNKRMIDLVNDFLNISRIELGTFKISPVVVDYKNICENVLRELESKIIAKGHVINKNYQEKMPETMADPKLLNILFQNLISNSVKYTQNKGKISIFIGTDKKEILIKVSNSGKPIPIADQDKIFQRMFRASDAQEMDPDGNGLGLYLLKNIVEAAGGKIWFESKEGVDTVFFVTFPLPGMKIKE